MLFWDFHNDEERISKNSLTMIQEILRSKAKGSLFSLLVKNNYANQIDVDPNDIFKSVFRLFTVEIDVTESGMLAYQEVIALVFEYFRKLKDEWLDNGNTLDLFDEYKTVSQLSYDIFEVYDKEEYTCYLAETMLNIHNPKKLLKKSAAMPVIDDYDV